jgi:hypothetical protein
MKRTLIAVGMTCLMGWTMTGCYNDNVEELYPAPTGNGCDTTNVTYNGAIKNIFNQSCGIANCHATGSAPGGYILDNYAGSVAAANSGRLLGAINHAPGYSAMPKNMSKLAPCDITRIQVWVNKGMPQ